MGDLPYYVDDPLMDDVRREHRRHLEPQEVESAARGFTVYAAWCTGPGCPWISRGVYDRHGQDEEFDQHMRDLQQYVHATQAGADPDAPASTAPNPEAQQ